MEFLDLVQIQDYLVDGAGTTEAGTRWANEGFLPTVCLR